MSTMNLGLPSDTNWEYNMRLDNELANKEGIVTMAFDMLTKIERADMSHISRKRITHECSELLKLNIYDFNVERSEKNEIVLSFYKIHNNKKTHYVFILDSYPFKTPTIYINNISLQDFIKVPSEHLSLLKDWKHMECLCCHSFLSNHNWSALISFQNIIAEISRLKDIKAALYILALTEKIKYKYLVKDIDLSSWIYA